MLIMINGDNKMNMKRYNVRIIRIILDLHGVIVDSRTVVPFDLLHTYTFLHIVRLFLINVEALDSLKSMQ